MDWLLTAGAIAWQLQILLGIPVADVFNHATQQRIIVGQFPPRHVLPNDVAKHPPKILVPRIRHERSRIGHHAYKTRQEASIRESVDLLRDALLLIEEPPRRSVLKLARFPSVLLLSILEGANQSGELKCVLRIHVVYDHLRQRVLPSEQVEVGGEALALGKITNGVIARIGPKRPPRGGIHVTKSAQMQLLCPSFLGVQPAKKKHHERSKLHALIRSD